MFENAQIESNQLPKVASVNWEALEPKYMTIGLIQNTILWLIPILGFSILFFFKSDEIPSVAIPVISSVVILLMLFAYFIVVKGFYKKGYAVRERDIIYKEGVFWQSVTSIPFNRIQHCEVKQGPISRIFGLSKLSVYTAGGANSDLSIPGLTLERAQQMKSFLLNKTSLDDEQE